MPNLQRSLPKKGEVFKVLNIFLFSILTFSFLYLRTSWAASPEEASNKGIFVLVQANHFFDNTNDNQWRGDAENQPIFDVLNRDYVSGFTYWVSWAKLEPQEGQYEWDLIDKIVGKVAQTGKKINIGVLPGWAPNFINNDPNIEKFTYTREVQGGGTETVTKSFPLDSIYLDKYYYFVNKLANHIPTGRDYHFKDDPTVHYIAVGGPSNETGLETFIKSNNNLDENHPEIIDDKENYPVNWVKHQVIEITKSRFGDSTISTFNKGYNLIWQEAIRKFATAFPNKHLAIGLNLGLATPDYKHRTSTPAKWIRNYLISQDYKNDYGVPAHLMFFGLTGKDWFLANPNGTQVEQLIDIVATGSDYGLTSGYQMTGIAWANKDEEERARPFDKAMENGVQYGTSWLEVWLADLKRNRDYHQRSGVDEIHPCIRALCPGTFEETIENPAIEAAQQLRPPINFSLVQGWNKIVWPSDSAGKKSSDVPDVCPIAVSQENFWFKPYVRDYGGVDFGFEKEKTFWLKCSQKTAWEL